MVDKYMLMLSIAERFYWLLLRYYYIILIKYIILPVLIFEYYFKLKVGYTYE